jgi:pimeloyl-ACP methyl ester carboxylesterase
MKKNIMFILFMLLVSGCLCAQTNRTPFFVHGYNSDATQWQNWQALFNSERVMTMGNNTTYTSSQGVAAMAGNVATALNNAASTSPIYFGHSMGGVVGMHVDANGLAPGRVGGIITAGSPLDGTVTVNNVQNGNVINFATSGLDKVLKGPIRQFGAAQGANYTVQSYLVRELADNNIDLIVDEILPQAQTQSAIDLSQGSAYMNSGVRSITTATPKVLIYGNEHSPVLWRIASSVMGQADNYLVDIVSDAAVVYEAWKIVGLASLDPMQIWMADGWAQGQSWLESGAENGWNDIIGASTPDYFTYQAVVIDYNIYWDCMNGGDPGIPQYPDETPEEHCTRASEVTVIYYVYSPVNGLSDGFVKAPSQTGFFTGWSYAAARVEALGVNHAEMDDHPAMRTIFDGIFDGTIQGVSPYFSTVRR